jgi:hypothetical protein
MKKSGLVIAVCILIGAALLFSRSPKKDSPERLPPPAAVPASNAPAAEKTLKPTGLTNAVAVSNAPAIPGETLASRAGQVPPDTNEPVHVSPEIVLQNIRRAVHQYGQMFDGNPVGTNPEITAALSGKNPRGINFLGGETGVKVDSNGNMIDEWGTPYFFHQLSATDMEIHSAGPDKVMWTSDDLVIR